ncbi:DUF2997 domain-containing protein [Myxococcota bacterium]|nr:DUF2997 domain-containing protein [Myxococcota bacterium]MBU1429264.1 DUF2997 domain-containing protein [Myxococcota bacterium]MBU1897359.1 DUF2997 domain-containing protein [Myxococcota bacterium]
MAVRQEIEIQISPDGEISLHVKGLSGEACLELTQALEAQLGEVVDRQKTSEYYQQEIEATTTVEVGED